MVLNFCSLATHDVHQELTFIPKAATVYRIRLHLCTEFWWGNQKERDHWEDPGIDGRIILRWIFRK
jgi:hypothetical protein